MSAIDGVSRQQLIQQALGQIGPSKVKQPTFQQAVSKPIAKADAPRSLNSPQALRPTFETVEQARLQAAVTRGEDNPKNLASLDRLNQVLDAGEPLRGDVPRGYYLNLEV